MRGVLRCSSPTHDFVFAEPHFENRAAVQFVHRPDVPSDGFCGPCTVGLENRLPRFGEYVIRKLRGRDRQQRLGLGAEGGEFLGDLLVNVALLPDPTGGPVVALTGLAAVPDALVGHGEEDEIQSFKLAAVGGQASVQGRDGDVIPAYAVLDDAERVQEDAPSGI